MPYRTVTKTRAVQKKITQKREVYNWKTVTVTTPDRYSLSCVRVEIKTERCAPYYEMYDSYYWTTETYQVQEWYDEPQKETSPGVVNHRPQLQTIPTEPINHRSSNNENAFFSNEKARKGVIETRSPEEIELDRKIEFSKKITDLAFELYGLFFKNFSPLTRIGNLPDGIKEMMVGKPLYLSGDLRGFLLKLKEVALRHYYPSPFGAFCTAIFRGRDKSLAQFTRILRC